MSTRNQVITDSDDKICKIYYKPILEGRGYSWSWKGVSTSARGIANSLENIVRNATPMFDGRVLILLPEVPLSPHTIT